MMQIVAFFILTFLMAVALAQGVFLAAYGVIARLRKKTHPQQLIRLKKTALFLMIVVILNAGLITFSQFTAYTPSIVDENGNKPENSIAELREIELNGRKQWISLRGWDKNAPVLLFLAGGPGGTQMAAVRHELAELEKHFVIVNWDQPGSGKSYYATNIQKHNRPNLYSGWSRSYGIPEGTLFSGENLPDGGIMGQCLRDFLGS